MIELSRLETAVLKEFRAMGWAAASMARCSQQKIDSLVRRGLLIESRNRARRSEDMEYGVTKKARDALDEQDAIVADARKAGRKEGRRHG